ncbi:MAG TPA: outer membrane protein assembly factor BamE [Caulobacteraceae bacterium]|nr:outer membrane protein assembly factor BamE [Caulobacteraceae bacterium]
MKLVSYSAFGLLALAACAPINSYEGFQAIDANPSQVKVGEDQASVLAKLGTPTAKSTFDNDTWFYITQVQSRTAFYTPRVIQRSVVAISFDKQNDQVASVDVFGLKDGRIIPYDARATPTRGRQATLLESLFGSIGSVSSLPPDQNQTPGTHPGEP